MAFIKYYIKWKGAKNENEWFEYHLTTERNIKATQNLCHILYEPRLKSYNATFEL